MASPTEISNPLNYTPLYKNEQNEREILQWRLIMTKFYFVIKGWNGFVSVLETPIIFGVLDIAIGD